MIKHQKKGGSSVLYTAVCGSMCVSSFGTHSDFCISLFSFSQQGYSESPDLEFEYADTDKWAAELSGKADLHVTWGVFFSLLIFNKIKNKCHLEFIFLP